MEARPPWEGFAVLDLNLLATLKEKLRTATEFADVWRYFLDHFGENREFIDLGEPTRSEFLEAVLGQVGGQLFKTDRIVLEHVRFIRLPEHHFIHGGCTIRGVLANVLYFEDAGQGVMFVAESFKPGEVLYARFSGVPLPPGPPRPLAEPSLN
jgi:hypothetical protein